MNDVDMDAEDERPHPFRSLLIKLLVIIGLFLLLAAFIGPKMIHSCPQPRYQYSAKAQMAMLSHALDTYRLDTGHYPYNLNGLRHNNINNPHWNGPYTKKNIPKDPWDRDYHYRMPSIHGNDFDLFSYGADGKAGGKGENTDIVNW